MFTHACLMTTGLIKVKRTLSPAGKETRLQNYLKSRHRMPHVGRMNHKVYVNFCSLSSIAFTFASIDPDSNSLLFENIKNHYPMIYEASFSR